MTPEEIELLSELTIVIPTCNRPLELERAIEYWRDTPVTIHILDGSDDPWFPVGLLPEVDSIFYHHLPAYSGEVWSVNYARRLRFAATLPDTKYSALCADDDFFTKSGLVVVCEDLNRFRQIDAVVGICSEYSVTESTANWHLRYDAWRSSAGSKSSDVVTRVLDEDGSFYLYYGIIRTSVFKNIILNVFKNEYQHDYLIEPLFDAIGRAYCRTEVIRQILWIKKSWVINPNVPTAANRIRSADWFRSKQNQVDVSAFQDQVADGISSLLGDIDGKTIGRKLSKKITKKYLKNSETMKFRKKKKRILRILVLSGRYVPKSLKRLINEMLPLKIQAQTGFSTLPLLELNKSDLLLDDFMRQIDRTDITFFPKDLKEIEELILKPREELRLRANI